MQHRHASVIGILLLSVLASCGPDLRSQNVEVVTLDASNAHRWAPSGKEVDAIHGDTVLRNDRVTAVIANPVPGRNANMTVKEVAGCLIDLTHRNRSNDQLSAFYPGARRYPFRSISRRAIPESEGGGVELLCKANPAVGKPTVSVAYRLRPGAEWIEVETTYANQDATPMEVELVDEIRADKTFQAGVDGDRFVWVYDKWFNQAYGILPDNHAIHIAGGRTIRYLHNGQSKITLAPKSEHRLARKMIVADNTLALRAIANRLLNESATGVSIIVSDDSEAPVANALITLTRDGKPYGQGRTTADADHAALTAHLPAGAYKAVVTSVGRTDQTLDLTIPDSEGKFVHLEPVRVTMDQPGWVSARITDASGGPIPCKVQFIGVDGTEDPFFFVDSGEHEIHNLHYSHNGKFTQTIPPGTYEVVISYGPEYDAVTQRIEVNRGQTTKLQATLIRTVDTTGWISADFHTHSSPSGDNTSSQFGRVLNNLCEHLEFVPCTEHNRIDTYVPHLKRLGVEHLLATATGIELTGSPLPVNHQNAFPLILKPGLQDNGAPLTDKNPEVQIERLALWDNASKKLIQQNHPDVIQLIYDRDKDGIADGGYARALQFMDVMEVHPLEWIFEPPTLTINNRKRNNTIFNWMQTLNQGIRVPGVINTDAHYNFHGSGWMRNYIKSPTDDPAKIRTLDVVRESQAGHLIMTTGPFMQVRATASPNAAADPGDDLNAPDGQATLHIKVQCANWLDINRVQIYLNGRPSKEFNFTRKTHPDLFGDKVVKFDHALTLKLPVDTHIIVVAAGEGLSTERVAGPQWGKRIPIAVSNPIFVDVDGDGFKANGDTLDSPLPRKN